MYVCMYVCIGSSTSKGIVSLLHDGVADDGTHVEVSRSLRKGDESAGPMVVCIYVWMYVCMYVLNVCALPLRLDVSNLNIHTYTYIHTHKKYVVYEIICMYV